jgi:hypothetical protein
MTKKLTVLTCYGCPATLFCETQTEVFMQRCRRCRGVTALAFAGPPDSRGRGEYVSVREFGSKFICRVITCPEVRSSFLFSGWSIMFECPTCSLPSGSI